MVFEEAKIPYPNPYKDKDLMVKEIINGTFAVAMMATLASGQPISNRYVDFQNNNRFINNITKNATNIRTYVPNDDGMAYTLDQIKQMSYLPVYVEKSINGLTYLYYPPFIYKNFKFLPDDGIVIATFPANVSDYKGYDLYNVWDKNVGRYFAKVSKDENNNSYVEEIHLITIDGKDIPVATNLHLTNVVGFYAFKNGVCFIDKENNSYTAYIINIVSKTYKTIQLSNAYAVIPFGEWGLIAFGDKIYDANGTQWKVINDTGDTDFSIKTTDWYGASLYSSLGLGTIINNAYYLERTHTESYKFVRNIKEKTIKVKIVKNDLGEMTSIMKFGFFKNYFVSASENTKADIYHYVYKKTGDFYVTKMPDKISKINNTTDEWYCLSEYGDFIYNTKTDTFYWTWDFSNWFKIPEKDKMENLLTGVPRLWFRPIKSLSNLTGIFGKIDLTFNSDENVTELRAYGIGFYR